MSSKAFLLKMDQIIRQMINGNSPLPVKMQKYYRVTVPQAFTGIELIEWLMKNYDIDTIEAVHLATLLSQFGYVFPVFERNVEVKSDGTLFRLQIPYFWPSHNFEPDNVEYAIYLSKRLMRNEQKHGLEEHEAESYKKLRELLAHIWEFVNMQAEMQLKLFKEKKKVEKVVLDSQERAFWRLHRPPPNTPNPFDQQHGKADVRVLKKSTEADILSEIERMKIALKTKPWFKTKKQLETLVSGCEQFSEYDPFISGCQPSGNPWITDDTTLWTLNADYVDTPTERRVRRWAFSIEELIKDPIGRQVLETFLESEFSQENIRFWCAVQEIKYCPRSNVEAKVEEIHQEFLAAGAPCQVNVDSRTLEATLRAMKDDSIPRRYCFSYAEEHIFVLMAKDSYPRFVRSEIYKGVLNAAQQQGTRKGWKIPRPFTTTGTGKKLSVSPATTGQPGGAHPPPPSTMASSSSGGHLNASNREFVIESASNPKAAVAKKKTSGKSETEIPPELDSDRV